MPERVRDLAAFLAEIRALLQLIAQCRQLLFRRRFRDSLPPAIDDALAQLSQFSDHDYVRNPDQFQEMRSAGLAGPQLQLKLESFESAVVALDEDAGQDHLEEVLDKGAIILGSLAGAIPGFGSFASELLDFLIKELKKRFTWWQR